MHLQDLSSLASGSLVGFALGLFGGGGSILATPLLVYLVGVASPHIAIGTSAVAVSASALTNLVAHARSGNVRWMEALFFTVGGVAGAAFGAAFGKRVNSQALLGLFGVLMLLVAILSLIRNESSPSLKTSYNQGNVRLASRLTATGCAIGGIAGFFGIGGGFLIVPGLMSAARLPLINAIGTSLVAVAALGMTTALSYGASGLVNWRVAGVFIAGGVIGGVGGTALSSKLASRKLVLGRLFAFAVAAVGLYVSARGIIGS